VHGTPRALGDGVNTTNTNNNQFESTYGLIVRSEEKGRSVLETTVYSVFVLSVVLTIWQFAQTPIEVSAPAVKPCVACHTTTTQVPVRS
jgi:hypothetical protein